MTKYVDVYEDGSVTVDAVDDGEDEVVAELVGDWEDLEGEEDDEDEAGEVETAEDLIDRLEETFERDYEVLHVLSNLRAVLSAEDAEVDPYAGTGNRIHGD